MGGAFTVRLNEVILVSVPFVPATVTVEIPVGVVEDVLIVRVVEKVGLLAAGLKLQEAPEGKPEVQERLTV